MHVGNVGCMIARPQSTNHKNFTPTLFKLMGARAWLKVQKPFAASSHNHNRRTSARKKTFQLRHTSSTQRKQVKCKLPNTFKLRTTQYCSGERQHPHVSTHKKEVKKKDRTDTDPSESCGSGREGNEVERLQTAQEGATPRACQGSKVHQTKHPAR